MEDQTGNFFVNFYVIYYVVFKVSIHIEICVSVISQHSPGYSAKYTTYSLMDDNTDKVVHFELVQVSVHDNSDMFGVMSF